MRRLLASAAALSLLASATAEAQVLTGGLSVETVWDDNVFGTSEDEFDDWSVRISPRAGIREDTGDFEWELEYEPTYEWFKDADGIDGWSHVARGSAEWQLGPNTRVYVRDTFGYYQSVTRFNETVLASDGTTTLDPAFGRNRVLRNGAALELTHALTGRDSLSFEAKHLLLDRSGPDDRERMGARATYVHRLSERNTLGGFFSWSRIKFDSVGELDERHTDYYNLSASWEHVFDPTLTFRASAGPTLVDTDDDQDPIASIFQDRLRFPVIDEDGVRKLVDTSSCPKEKGQPFLSTECKGGAVVPDGLLGVFGNQRVDLPLVGGVPSSDDQSITFFANLGLTKQWERWSANLNYRRQDDATSGVGVSTVSDSVSGGLEYRPSDRWTFGLTASWIHQVQASEGIVPLTQLRASSGEVIPVPELGAFVLVPPGSAEAVGVFGDNLDQDITQDNYLVSFRVRHRWNKWLSITGNAFYRYQEQKLDTSDADRDTSRFRVFVGFEYNFDPIRL